MGFMASSIAASHYQNAFAAVYLSEEEIPEPRIVHFDNGFDVLCDTFHLMRSRRQKLQPKITTHNSSLASS